MCKLYLFFRTDWHGLSQYLNKERINYRKLLAKIFFQRSLLKKSHYKKKCYNINVLQYSLNS